MKQVKEEIKENRQKGGEQKRYDKNQSEEKKTKDKTY